MLRLPPAPARAAGPRKHPSPLHPNKLRVRLPPSLRRGHPPSLVHNNISLLHAFPQSPTSQLPRLQQPSLTSPLASCANPTPSSLLVSPPQLTSAEPFRARSLKRPPQLRPMPPTSSPSPGHYISPSPWGKTLGPSSSSPPPLDNWRYMPSRFVSSTKMKRNLSHISGRQFSRTKRPRFSQPGTLTRAEILGAPSSPLLCLSPSTPSTLRPLHQVSSSSPRSARWNLPSRQADPPSVQTVGDTGMPTNHARPPTGRAPSVRFTILARLIDVRIPPVPGAGTISQSHPVVRPYPPIAATALMTTLPPLRSVQLDLDILSPLDLPPQNPRVKTPWTWLSMGTKHPLLPCAGWVPVRWTS